MMRWIKKMLFAEEMSDREFIKLFAAVVVAMPFVLAIVYIIFAFAYLISLIGGGF